MLYVYGLRPADAQKNTSKDCDKRDNNNNNNNNKNVVKSLLQNLN